MFKSVTPAFGVPGVPPLAEMESGAGMGIEGLSGLSGWSETFQNIIGQFGKAGSQIVGARYGTPAIESGTRVVRDAQGNLIQISRQQEKFPLLESNLGASIEASPLSGNTLLVLGAVALGAVFLLRK